MRLSTDKSDRGYGDASHAHVTLNGIRIMDCVTADEELGEVVVLKRGRDGKYVIEGDNVACETRKGDVKITFEGQE